MAEVRAIEQQYWHLDAAYAQLRGAEKAVGTVREILNREQAELLVGRGTVADVAESAQRFEQFRLERSTRTSDVLTIERQLRKTLNLPPSDDRRIVPVTPPCEARLEPDLKKCLAAMFANQPDVVRAKRILTESEERRAEDLDKVAGFFLQELADDGLGHWLLPESQKEPLRRVVERARNAVVRSIREIDTSYEQFQTAIRLRNAAAQRLDSQRAYYEEGRITIDRFLDAVSQYAAAVASEARYRANYNIALVALEEDKGTLLDFDRIVVAEGPRGTGTPTAGTAGAREQAPRRQAAPVATPPAIAGATASPPAKDGGTGAGSAGKTYSFRLTIGGGPRPFEVPRLVHGRAGPGRSVTAAVALPQPFGPRERSSNTARL